MMREVAITGYGVFSGAGPGAEALFDNVFTGRPAFRRVARFTVSQYRARYAAHADACPTLANAFVDVARSALDMAELDPPHRAAVLLGTQGDWTGLTTYWREGSSDRLPDVAAGSHPHGLAAALGVAYGPRRAFVNGCVASATAITQGAQLIASGRENLVLCGGGYLVEEEFFGKFDSGRALTTASTIRPFSRDRSGLLLGDGVAILVLESLDAVRSRGVKPLAILAGWGLAGDAYHACRPHPHGKGLAQAITAALARAGMPASDVGYVNAHGTATKVNDPAETQAVRQVFGCAPPPVSSTKSTTGHALEGAGAVEAVICLLALERQLLPPTAGFTTPDPDCDLDCVPNEPRSARVDALVSTSVAFGGATAALVLRRYLP